MPPVPSSPFGDGFLQSSTDTKRHIRHNTSSVTMMYVYSHHSRMDNKKVPLRVLVPPDFKRKLKALAAVQETTIGAILRHLIGDKLDKEYEENVK